MKIQSGYQILKKMISRTFGNNSPETISRVSEQIANNNYTAAQVATIYGWNLGDTVDITLTTNEVIQMQIIGVNHDTLSSDHTSKAGLTLQMKNCLNTLYAMNSTDTNVGSWQSSEMRTTTLPAIYATLPSEWQSVIKMVDKKAQKGGGITTTFTTSDNLFLLSEYEIFGIENFRPGGANEGTQYAYWTSHNTTNDWIKYYDNAGTQTATTWWERSPNDLYNGFCAVIYFGDSASRRSSLTNGVSFAFCV